jgi:hypothetical protein
MPAYHKPIPLTFIVEAVTPQTKESWYSYPENIYVPDGSLEAYKTATGWSDAAAYIKPLSEYVD